MTYRELIELYKYGKLEDNQREKVKSDIERQEAISEYLFNESEIPGIENLKSENLKSELSESGFTEDQEDEAHKFIKMVNSTIRKAFIKMGAAIGIIVLAIVMFVIFALPKIADRLYYDPSEPTTKTGNVDTNKISLDLATYSEIFLPGYYREQVIVDGDGYGEYDINICQSSSYSGVFTNVAGKIKRGKMTLYDANLLKRPPANAFKGNKIYGTGAAGSYNDAIKALQDLDEHDYYLAFVSLSEIKKYSKFVDWCKESDINPVWCAIKDGDSNLGAGTSVGFIYSSSCGELKYDKDTYPYLSTFDAGSTTGEDQNWVVSEDVMTTHVISLFKYIAKQTAFNKMIKSGVSSDVYSEIADDVEKNGLNIYGFTVVAQKNTLLSMSKADGVAYIYTQPMK